MNTRTQTTEKEIDFLAKLGTHRKNQDVTQFTRLQLLEGYQKSLETKFDWGAMDPAKIATAVETMIAQEKAEKNFATELHS